MGREQSRESPKAPGSQGLKARDGSPDTGPHGVEVCLQRNAGQMRAAPARDSKGHRLSSALGLVLFAPGSLSSSNTRSRAPGGLIPLGKAR